MITKNAIDRLVYMTLCLLIGAIGGLLAAAPAAGQSIERIEERLSNVSSYYYHAQPGASTMQVYALGTVRNPGVYELAEGTGMGKLMALSGGPVEDVLQDANKRRVVIRVVRPNSNQSEPIYQATVQNGEMPDPESYPTLQDGDIMQVEVIEEQTFTWRDGLSVVNAAGVIVLAIVRFSTGR